MSNDSVRFVKYLSFFTKDAKMFDKIHYLLNKDLTDKTEFIQKEEDLNLITQVIFRYKIVSKTNKE
jgi:hypothetical protein